MTLAKAVALRWRATEWAATIPSDVDVVALCGTWPIPIAPLTLTLPRAVPINTHTHTHTHERTTADPAHGQPQAEPAAVGVRAPRRRDGCAARVVVAAAAGDDGQPDGQGGADAPRGGRAQDGAPRAGALGRVCAHGRQRGGGRAARTDRLAGHGRGQGRAGRGRVRNRCARTGAAGRARPPRNGGRGRQGHHRRAAGRAPPLPPRHCRTRVPTGMEGVRSSAQHGPRGDWHGRVDRKAAGDHCKHARHPAARKDEPRSPTERNDKEK